MTTSTSEPVITQHLSVRLAGLLSLLRKGSVIEAFERYYAPDVSMQENELPPTVGFDANLQRERAFIASLAEWHSFRVLATGSAGDHTFYESITEWTSVTGTRVRQRQVSIARWRNGRIIEERFVYAPPA